MHIAAVALSLLLAVAMLGSGVMKLLGTAQMTENMRVVNVSVPQMRVLGVLELLATVGLVVGLWVPAIGIAAAIGAVVYFAGAVVAHVRAHEKNVQPAAVLFVFAVATLVVLLLAL
ncbi:DoxX family protein [Curtobacterium sp. SL109]|uniref:DoxX family protein n=1 Tax=Curtobacterium sp. SL109 TaxID=2994662 RepID=UPI002272AD2D|nr:DoxX family protein [Curtobacterium sp. SL109]MCY1693787.1 DoxX family protein [Curtobacterium sp. SL109]